MNNIYQQLNEIKLLWKQLKHYDTKKSSLSNIENVSLQETEDEILSGPEALKKLENVSQQLNEIIENENKFKDKVLKQIHGIISSVKYFCEILSLEDDKYKDIETINDSDCLIDKREKLQILELELNHMVSERKSLIKELKKELNSMYLELGELSYIDEDIKFEDLSYNYINKMKNDIVQLKINQMKNINDFIFKTQDYYLLKENLKYSSFFQENEDSLKFKHVDNALELDCIPIQIKTFLNQINDLKLKDNITNFKNIQEINLKDIVDNIIENYFIPTSPNEEKNIKIESNDNDNNDVEDTIPFNIPETISSAVIKHLNNFKEELPKSVKLTNEFMKFLNDIIELMSDKLNYYLKEMGIILKNIKILYDDLKIDISKQLKLEADKLENIPIYEEELKNLSKMWQITQKERVDNAYNQLKLLISKCCLSQEEIDDINSNITNLYLPSSLEFINNEIERLTNHYEKYKIIYQLIDERYTLIDKMIKFEETASDPGRLKGSSFRLIEEEKFRKNSFPTLVRIEEKLKNYLMNDEYSDFCYEGQLYLDILENEIENRVFNEAMFHINNQITYRPKKRPSNIDKRKLKPDKSALIKSPNSTSSQSNSDGTKKVIKFKSNILTPSNNSKSNISITSPSNNTIQRKRKVSLSSSITKKRRKSSEDLKNKRKSLPTSL